MSNNQRPIPAPNADTAPFWEAARSGKLCLPVCRDCHRVLYPPRRHCPDCLSDALDWTALSGKAVLRGWTDLCIPVFSEDTGPVTIAECTLIEDDRAVLALIDETGSLRDCAPDTPVIIGFSQDSNGQFYPHAQAAEPKGTQ